MGYAISGDFVEACDCYGPCWLDAEPDEGHCLGLFAWMIGDGSAIDGVEVAGRVVVSVSNQDGYRRGGGASTAIFVDRGASEPQFDALIQAFSGALDGPLCDLATVSGEIVQRDRAAITVNPAEDGWRVTVDADQPDGTQRVVDAAVKPKVFDGADGPLTLRQTGLTRELGSPSDSAVTAQQGDLLAVRLPALRAGSMEAVGRSAMRGKFVYDFPVTSSV
jgi:hypothetical protein